MQIEPLRQKLTKFKSGSVLVTKEEREQTEKVHSVKHMLQLVAVVCFIAVGSAPCARQEVFVTPCRPTRSTWMPGTSENVFSRTYGM